MAGHSEITDEITVRIEFNGLEVWSGEPEQAARLLALPSLYDEAAKALEEAQELGFMPPFGEERFVSSHLHKLSVDKTLQLSEESARDQLTDLIADIEKVLEKY